ncbi:DUF6545 domain-containing protein [Streptomyces decoyicus]|uniref:DUF6545 domain-containing protein n=1 Tax=Streptomyces decoyicus TaxID=249567 RepID=UPI003628A3ED
MAGRILRRPAGQPTVPPSGNQLGSVCTRVERDPACQVDAHAVPRGDVDQLREHREHQLGDCCGLRQLAEQRRQHHRGEPVGTAHYFGGTSLGPNPGLKGLRRAESLRHGGVASGRGRPQAHGAVAQAYWFKAALALKAGGAPAGPVAAFEQQHATDQDGEVSWLRHVANAYRKTDSLQAQCLLATAGATA